MDRRIVATSKAPAAIGPYSQAVEANGVVYVSGQIPLDPASGEIVGGGIEGQTRQVLENLKNVLEAAGSGFGKALKVTIFLTDMDAFGEVNGIYGEYFKENPPARACVEVSALPRGVLVEMDAVALDGRSKD